MAEWHLLDGDLDRARELLEAELEATLERGPEYLRAQVLTRLVQLELRAGNWDLAERQLEDAWEIEFDGGGAWGEAHTLSQRALVAALRGRAEDARRLAAESAGYGESWRLPSLVAMNRGVLGFLELSVGDHKGAMEALSGLPERLERAGVAFPGFLPDAIPDAVEALVGLDRLDGAEATLARLSPRWHPHRWGTQATLRCQALLLLGRGESEAALAAAEQAAAGFEHAGFPLDRGRSVLVGGEALRRAGERRRAAEKLEAAKAIFAELGAPLWVARAENELRRASPRPRRDRELTGAERRVAALVAGGRTNREVAAQLFTTVATVEAHLTRVYRKVGVRSRTELARRVAEGRLELHDRE